MKRQFSRYISGYRIVSIAHNEAVLEDLLDNNNLDTLLISNNQVILYPTAIELSTTPELYSYLEAADNYDVMEIWPDGTIRICFSAKLDDTVFFITGKCNSSCIMCPSPQFSREHGEQTSIDTLIDVAKHMPDNVSHITITGGEPFLAGRSLFELLAFLQSKFQDTEFLILTNGRAFAIKDYVQLLGETIPNNCMVGVPIHGSNSQLHDYITQSPGSFIQTICGIKQLLKHGINVEIRIVVSRINADNVYEIAKMIVTELPAIDHVSFIAMEMTGDARKNNNNLWIPYRSAFQKIKGAIVTLISKGISVKLYNFPLCTVDKQYWLLAEKSISPEKVRYAEECNQCGVKDSCGGIFAGTLSFAKEELRPVNETEFL